METTTKTETVKKSIFGAAKDAAKKPAAKDKHEIVILKEKDFPGISENLKEYFSLSEQIEELTSKQKMINGVVKEIAKDKFLELYTRKQRNPDSFKIQGELGGSAMIIPMDKYITIKDEGRANEIIQKYGKDVVDQKTIYSFDPILLEKYETVISEMIENSTAIEEKDKANLLQAKVTTTIKKGTIDTLYAKFGNKMKEVLTAIEPIFQIKNCKETSN